MRELVLTNKFRKDLKTITKRGVDKSQLNEVIDMLQNDIMLPRQYKDHGLAGKYIGLRECHIQPNWLLIYEKSDKELILILQRTGSHSDLFR